MFGSNSTYRVVFWGATKVGEDKTDVALRFAKRFGLRDVKALKRLFSGRVITLKKGLNHLQASQFSDVVHELGAVCRIEREISLASDFLAGGVPSAPGRHNSFVDLGRFGDVEPSQPVHAIDFVPASSKEEVTYSECDRRDPFAARGPGKQGLFGRVYARFRSQWFFIETVLN